VDKVKNVFFGAAVVCFVAGFSLSSLRITRSAQRRIYWLFACLAGVSGFLMCYPDRAKGLGVAGLFVAAMVVAAYAATPYIKIRGKIFALSLADSQPDGHEAATHAGGGVDPTPDSYSGMLSAAKLWWMLAIVAVIAGGNVYYAAVGREKGVIPWASAAFLALLALGAGYADGSWNYPLARRQYIQLAAASLVTVGVFLALYLVSYYMATRWPLRRERSLEYRTHPRHGVRRPLDQ
jgi:hypothetical protein